jgi:hypothetical protein
MQDMIVAKPLTRIDKLAIAQGSPSTELNIAIKFKIMATMTASSSVGWLFAGSSNADLYLLFAAEMSA